MHPSIPCISPDISWHLRAEQHHQPASLLASLLLGRVYLSRHLLGNPLHLPSLALEAGAMSRQQAFPFNSRSWEKNPCLGCKVCLLGLVCEKETSPMEQSPCQVVQEPIHPETLLPPFSFNISAHFESSAKAKFPAMRSHSPASSLLETFGCFFTLQHIVAKSLEPREQRLPRHLFCSSHCCYKEAQHTQSFSCLVSQQEAVREQS